MIDPQEIPKEEHTVGPKELNEQVEVYDFEGEAVSEPLNEWSFFKSISVTSIQISATVIVLELIWNINLIFIGHLNNPEYVAAAGLSDMLIYFSGAIFVIGLNEGFSSLAARAYGAGHYKLIGTYLNKGFLLIFILFLTIVVLSLMGEEILVFLFQHENTSRLAQKYMVALLPTILFEFTYDLLRAYLNCMEIYHVHSTISLVTTVIHPFFCMAFFDFGFLGMAYATNITQFLNVLAISIYILVVNPCPESLFFAPSGALKGFGKYVLYVVPIAMPIYFDACFYGAKTLIIGSFKNPIMLAAHVFITNIFEIIYCIFLGINVSLNTLSANAVGERSVHKCKLLLKFAFFIGFALGIILMITFLFFSKQIFHIFTTEENIIEVILSIKEIIASFVILDYVQSSLQGIIKGVGLGHSVLYAAIVSYWIIGLPSCFLLGVYFNLQIKGVWLGYGIATIVFFLINTFVVLRIDWPELVAEKYEEMREEKRLMDKEEEQFLKEFDRSTDSQSI